MISQNPLVQERYQYRKVTLSGNVAFDINNRPWIYGQDSNGFQLQIFLDYLPPAVGLTAIEAGQMWWICNKTARNTWTLDSSVGEFAVSLPSTGAPIQYFTETPLGNVTPIAAGYFGQNSNTLALFYATDDTPAGWVQIAGVAEDFDLGISGTPSTGLAVSSNLSALGVGITIIEYGKGAIQILSGGIGNGILIQNQNTTSSSGIVIQDNSPSGLAVDAAGSGGLFLNSSGGGPIGLSTSGGQIRIGTGSGQPVMMSHLPTSNPSNPGQLWNNGGVVTVS